MKNSIENKYRFLRSDFCQSTKIGAQIWWTQDRLTIIFVIKFLLACLLALWVSLFLELEQPRTSMLTVALVMQPKSGMVFSKSFYRFVGSLVGVVATFILIALFAQERILFIIYLAIWVGLCTSGSMMFRYYHSYAFALAGYTVCIVGMPSVLTPELTFNIALIRVSEVFVGLLSAVFISDMIFPQRVGDVLSANVKRRYQGFLMHLRTITLEKNDTASRTKSLKVLSDVFELENFRASLSFENDATRSFYLWLGKINAESMTASTSFHSFEQYLKTLINLGHEKTVELLVQLYTPIQIRLLQHDLEGNIEKQAQLITEEIRSYEEWFPRRVALINQQLQTTEDVQSKIDFLTGVELLQNFINDLLSYTSTFTDQSLNNKIYDIRSVEPISRIGLHYDPWSTFLAGARCSITLIILALIWISTDWRSGGEAITMGIIVLILYAPSPNPFRIVQQLIIGTLFGMVLLFICNFFWLTQAQGWVMLSLALTPGLLIAGWYSSKSHLLAIGTGISLTFLMHGGFNSIYSANPVNFINESVADLLALIISGALFILMNVTTSNWSRNRSHKSLRHLVIDSCIKPIPRDMTLIEIKARDIVQRLSGAQRVENRSGNEVIDWMFSTLEISKAIIKIRALSNQLKNDFLKKQIFDCIKAVMYLYRMPSIKTRSRAIQSISSTIDFVDKDSNDSSKIIRNYLNFIFRLLVDNKYVLTDETMHSSSKGI